MDATLAEQEEQLCKRAHSESDPLLELKAYQAEASSEEKITRLSSRQAHLLSQLQVLVSVEIGTIQVSLEQLIDIAQGQIFTFSYDDTRPVVLKVGEECVAHAQLVKKNGELGLQIISTDSEKNCEISDPSGQTRR